MTAKIISLHDRDQSRVEAEAIAAQSDPATLPKGDVGLIEAERRLRELRAAEAHSDLDFWISVEIFGGAEGRLEDFINQEAPQTLAGAAVKLRCLIDPESGELGGRDDNVLSLRQILELIEPEARS